MCDQASQVEALELDQAPLHMPESFRGLIDQTPSMFILSKIKCKKPNFIIDDICEAAAFCSSQGHSVNSTL